MLIRNFGDYQDSYDMDDLSNCGIIKHKRTIIIFVNRSKYEHKLCKSAKFALINECVYDGSGDSNMASTRIHNSTVNRTSIYFGIVNYEIPNDIRTAYFRVEVGINKERQTLHDTDEVHTKGTSSVSTLTSHYSRDVVDELVCGFETTVIPPKFYTERHMYLTTGDFGSFITDIQENEYPYHDIIDRSTTFEYMDIDLWDTMKTEIINKAADPGTKDGLNVAEAVLSSFEYTLIKGSTFIYDSDGKGMNSPGVNVLGGKITNGKFIPKKFAVDNLGRSLLLFDQACHQIENTYGHIRVMCCPTDIGSKLKIQFKDYVKPPVKGFGNATDAHFSSNIDDGYSKNLEIGEALYTMSKNIEGDGMYM